MQKISKKLKVILGARKTPYAIEKNSLNKIILVKSPKRIKTNSIVFRDQFNYGHREILLDYLGLDHSHAIVGRLQHGLFDPSITSLRTPINIRLFKQAPFFVYSKVIENISKTRGFSHVKAIGCPWFYLPKVTDKEKKTIESKKFLIMPEHSTANYPNISSIKEKQIRASFFRSIIGDQKATVCLHHIDYLELATRNSYLEQGFEVTCAGVGYNIIPWSIAGDRVNFLPNLRHLILQHDNLIAESINIQVFFATSLGKKVGIFPGVNSLIKLGSFGSRSNAKKFESSYYFSEELNQNFKKVYNTCDYLGNSEELLNQFLGYDSILTKDELRNRLVLEPNVYPINL